MKPNGPYNSVRTPLEFVLVLCSPSTYNSVHASQCKADTGHRHTLYEWCFGTWRAHVAIAPSHFYRTCATAGVMQNRDKQERGSFTAKQNNRKGAVAGPCLFAHADGLHLSVLPSCSSQRRFLNLRCSRAHPGARKLGPTWLLTPLLSSQLASSHPASNTAY